MKINQDTWTCPIFHLIVAHNFYLEKSHLKDFKYTGGTDSILYEYLWSPFAEYLLRFFPLWVAPNVITFVALLILVIVHIIFMLPDESDYIPAWKLIMMAVAIFVYQHLDNIDGKQARRTSKSIYKYQIIPLHWECSSTMGQMLFLRF